MTGNATALTRGNVAAQARESREYVRSLLKVRQPQFAAALESAARKLMRDHRTVCASSEREYLMTDGSVVAGSAATGSAASGGAGRREAGDQERELLIASIDELTPEGRRHVAALVEWLRNRASPASADR